MTVQAEKDYEYHRIGDKHNAKEFAVKREDLVTEVPRIVTLNLRRELIVKVLSLIDFALLERCRHLQLELTRGRHGAKAALRIYVRCKLVGIYTKTLAVFMSRTQAQGQDVSPKQIPPLLLQKVDAVPKMHASAIQRGWLLYPQVQVCNATGRLSIFRWAEKLACMLIRGSRFSKAWAQSAHASYTHDSWMEPPMEYIVSG